AYVNKILQQFKMAHSKPVSTPAETSQHLSEADSPKTEEAKKQMQSVPYRSLVGELMYAAMSTRPDIAHAANRLSRFLHNPGQTHWKAAKRVLRYLAGTAKLGLSYIGGNNRANSNLQINAYADADCVGW